MTCGNTQKFEHVGVGHHPSVHAGICNSHMCHYMFRFICSWLNQRRHSTMFRLRWTPPQKWIQTLTSCWQKVALSTCMDVNKCLDLDFPRCYMCENLNLKFKKKKKKSFLECHRSTVTSCWVQFTDLSVAPFCIVNVKQRYQVSGRYNTGQNLSWGWCWICGSFYHLTVGTRNLCMNSVLLMFGIVLGGMAMWISLYKLDPKYCLLF